MKRSLEEDAAAQGGGAVAEDARHSTAARATPAPAGCDVRYAITFGEKAVLHVGGAEIGSASRCESGYSVQALREIADGINSTRVPRPAAPRRRSSLCRPLCPSTCGATRRRRPCS